jgi:hypothetical protein
MPKMAAPPGLDGPSDGKDAQLDFHQQTVTVPGLLPHIGRLIGLRRSWPPESRSLNP